MLPQAALVISLPRNELGRFKTFIARWKFSKIPLTKIEGVDGLKETIPPTWTNGLGTLGCLLAHIKAIKFARENNYESVLLMEDDIRFIQDFEKELEDVMNELPENWDTFWLGGYEEERGEVYSKRLRYNIGSWGGYAMILRNTVYDFFIEKLEQLDLPCDEHYCRSHKLFNSFRTYKPYILHNHISSVRTNADNGIAV